MNLFVISSMFSMLIGILLYSHSLMEYTRKFVILCVIVLALYHLLKLNGSYHGKNAAFSGFLKVP